MDLRLVNDLNKMVEGKNMIILNRDIIFYRSHTRSYISRDKKKIPFFGSCEDAFIYKESDKGKRGILYAYRPKSQLKMLVINETTAKKLLERLLKSHDPEKEKNVCMALYALGYYRNDPKLLQIVKNFAEYTKNSRVCKIIDEDLDKTTSIHMPRVSYYEIDPVLVHHLSKILKPDGFDGLIIHSYMHKYVKIDWITESEVVVFQPFDTLQVYINPIKDCSQIHNYVENNWRPYGSEWPALTQHFKQGGKQRGGSDTNYNDISEYLHDQNILHDLQVKIGDNIYKFKDARRVGSGGSKIAWNISDKYVLMLPNTSHDDISGYWDHVVADEVKWSNIIKAFGLLTTNNKRVDVRIDDNILSAYISTNFKYYEKYGMYVFESKTKDPIFHLNYKNTVPYLHCMFKSLYKDAVNMYRLNLSAAGDSFNILLIKRKSKECEYQVRYLGFDFSSKNSIKAIPHIKYIDSKSIDDLTYYIKRVVSSALQVLFIDIDPSILDDDISNFVGMTIEKYVNPEQLPFGMQYVIPEPKEEYDVLELLGLK